MPKVASDYSKTVIYKIVCNDLNITDNYVGHTANFRIRKNHHKSICNNPNSKKHHLKVYQIIRDNGGWDNWAMLQIEEYPCENKHEASFRERYWYEVFNSRLNSILPFITPEEEKQRNQQNSIVYRQINAEIMTKKKEEYRRKNAEKLCQNSKIYYENNVEKVKNYKDEYYQKNKEAISKKYKEYREKNSEVIKQRKKEYSIKNKEKIALHNKEYRLRKKQKKGQAL